MQKIIPHLWFDKEAKEAAEFYVDVLGGGSKVTGVTTLENTPSGSVDMVAFELLGQKFMAISAGPLFKFNPSISFHIKCKTKDEVDPIWNRLSDGGKVLMPLDAYPFSERYGWTEDKYGLSWQVIYAGDQLANGDQRITPVFMFVGKMCGKAGEAVNFYASVFKNGKAEVLARYGKSEEPDKEGTVKYAAFILLGQEFGAMDSARLHDLKFNEAISLMVYCKGQKEIDYYWNKLSAVPESEQCGWLKDKYGVSWQIVPEAMGEMMATKDKEALARVTEAFLKMKKFDIAELKKAYEQE